MRIIEDNFEELARKAIQKHGHCEEHNYEHFLNLGTTAKIPIFVSFEDDIGILALKSKTGKVWYVIREVLAPKEKKTELLLNFTNHVLNELNMERLEIELEDSSRNELLEKLNSNGLRACPVNYHLDWPLFDIQKWDGDKMEGKDWKKLRNIRNKFYREHKVEVLEPEKFSKEELKRIIKEWREKRNAGDFAYKHEYINVIDADFSGFDEARILVVDGKPRTITGGWKVPNSDQYYSSLGVLDYSIDRLGEIANLDDLNYLKKKGYRIINFGGSDEDLLTFKKKFKPHSQYRTYTFSIKKK